MSRPTTWLDTTLRHPRTTVAVQGAVFLLLGSGLLSLDWRLGGNELTPADAQEVRDDAAIRSAFGASDALIVMVEAPRDDERGIFTREVLGQVRELTAALAALPGMTPGDVFSLATELSPRVAPGTLDFLPWLEPLPETDAELDALRSSLLEFGVFRGTLLAVDSAVSATAIVVAVRDGVDPQRLAAAVAEVAAASAGPARVSVCGAPVLEAALGRHVILDLARLLPLVGLLVIALLYLWLRDVRAVAVVGFGVAGVVGSTFGLMGYCGVPVYLTTVVLPVVLVATGVTDELHWIAALRRAFALGAGLRGSEEIGASDRDRARGPRARKSDDATQWKELVRRADDAPGPRSRSNPAPGSSLPLSAAVRQAALETRRPIAAAALTSAIGFSSLALAPLAPVRAFGAFAAVGLLIGLAWTQLAFPALALLCGERLARPSRVARVARRDTPSTRTRTCSRWMRAMKWQMRRRTAVLAGAAALTLLAPFAIARIQVRESWLSGFAADAVVRRTSERFERLFGGLHALRVHVRAADGTLLEHGRMAGLQQLERLAAGAPGVGAVLGPGSYLTAACRVLRPQALRDGALPADPRALEWLIRRFRLLRGEGRPDSMDSVDSFLEPDLGGGLVTLYLRGADQERTRRLMLDLTAAATELLPGLSLRFGGDAAVSTALVEGIVRTQVSSLATAIPGVFVILALALRSVVAALLAVIPAALATLLSLAGMGLLGVPLGVATSLFAATTVGVGVDFAIHLESAWRTLLASGCGRVRAALRATASLGGALALDVLVVAGGCLLLAASDVPANARLGAMLAANITLAALATWLVLPLLLAGRPRSERSLRLYHAGLSGA